LAERFVGGHPAGLISAGNEPHAQANELRDRKGDASCASDLIRIVSDAVGFKASCPARPSRRGPMHQTCRLNTSQAKQHGPLARRERHCFNFQHSVVEILDATHDQALFAAGSRRPRRARFARITMPRQTRCAAVRRPKRLLSAAAPPEAISWQSVKRTATRIDACFSSPFQ
jgi:hypothetical protein